ncbi:MAG: tetratricopeptide repeat protein [Saprospiraceae bacterium]|nr:tetratricopeptide repeat protein [Saprospiraceae bacterium]
MDRRTALLNLLKDSPDDAFLTFALAKQCESEEQLDEALELFHKLSTLHPDYIGLYYHYGKLLDALDRTPEAEEVFREGIDRATAQGDLHAAAELRGALEELDLP